MCFAFVCVLNCNGQCSGQCAAYSILSAHTLYRVFARKTNTSCTQYTIILCDLFQDDAIRRSVSSVIKYLDPPPLQSVSIPTLKATIASQT